MCGLCGFVDLKREYSREESLQIVTAMADALFHRGPDDSGASYDDGSCAAVEKQIGRAHV